MIISITTTQLSDPFGTGDFRLLDYAFEQGVLTKGIGYARWPKLHSVLRSQSRVKGLWRQGATGSRQMAGAERPAILKRGLLTFKKMRSFSRATRTNYFQTAVRKCSLLLILLKQLLTDKIIILPCQRINHRCRIIQLPGGNLLTRRL